MPDYDFDLITMGAGSGGVAASRRASAHGARVLLCEADSIGGTCVMRGCVPKKLLMVGAHFREEFADAHGFGYQHATPEFSWPALLAAKNREIARLSAVYEKLLTDAKVELAQGRAVVCDPHTVRIGDRKHSARHILLATGGRPVRPSVVGAELGICSSEALSLPELPRRLMIIGGGYVGAELASIFHGFGCQVTLLARDEQLLPGFDGDIRRALGRALIARGIRVRFSTSVQSLERTSQGIAATLVSGAPVGGPRPLSRSPLSEIPVGGPRPLSRSPLSDEHELGDVVLFAVGRSPNSQELGLAEAGVELDARGAIKVDDYSRSNVPSIHAVGDCTDRLNLTPVAIYEGRALADTLFGNTPSAVVHEGVPSAVFTDPPLAFVGLSEEKARARGLKTHCYVKSFLPLKHALSGRDARTLMKLVVEQGSERVLGFHMLGSDAPELMQGFAVALRCGVTKVQLDATLGIHPTAAEEFVTMRREHCGPFEV